LVLGPRHDGSPDRLSGRFRLGCLGKDELTDPGVQTLGADDEVVGASRVVRKDHVDSTVVVVKAFDGDAESHGRLRGRHRLCEHLVQGRPGERHRRRIVGPGHLRGARPPRAAPARSDH
jgi:hypothetical protein